MPKYQNRSGEIVTFGEYQFAPFETRLIKRNIYRQPPVMFEDKNPEYNPYIMKMTQVQAGATCLPFLHNHSFILRIDDQFPPDFYDFNAQIPVINNNGSTLKISIYVTVSDYHIKPAYQLMRVVPFTKKYSHWVADVPGSDHIPQGLLDMEYEVVYIELSETNPSKLAVDVSIKPY